MLTDSTRTQAREMTSDLSIYHGPAATMAVVLLEHMDCVAELEGQMRNLRESIILTRCTECRAENRHSLADMMDTADALREATKLDQSGEEPEPVEVSIDELDTTQPDESLLSRSRRIGIDWTGVDQSGEGES